MAKPSCTFRHVLRTVNAGNGDLLVFGLEQWCDAERNDPDHIVLNGGYWVEVPFVSNADWLDGKEDYVFI